MTDPRTPLNPRPLHRLWLAPMALVAVGCLAFVVDIRISRFFEGGGSGFARQVIECGETFGHAVGVIFILLAVAVLDPNGRFKVPRLAACSLGAGLMADVVKMMVSRTRPHRFDLAVNDVLATFEGWFPLWTSGHGERSFPSAHTATAFGLAIGLAWLYPRGRFLFVGFAALCGLQRVESRAHYVSDVFMGAAVGWVWAACCLERTGLARFFDRLESPPLEGERGSSERSAPETQVPATDVPAAGGTAA